MLNAELFFYFGFRMFDFGFFLISDFGCSISDFFMRGTEFEYGSSVATLGLI
jgi:hypothetical protein